MMKPPQQIEPHTLPKPSHLTQPNAPLQHPHSHPLISPNPPNTKADLQTPSHPISTISTP
ncbi:hypothetical protein BDR22DRAFT_835649 [Usnea florida]